MSAEWKASNGLTPWIKTKNFSDDTVTRGVAEFSAPVTVDDGAGTWPEVTKY